MRRMEKSGAFKHYFPLIISRILFFLIHGLCQPFRAYSLNAHRAALFCRKRSRISYHSRFKGASLLKRKNAPEKYILCSSVYTFLSFHLPLANRG